MSIKKVPNNTKGHATGARMVDPQIVKWRRENRKKGRVIGKAMAKEKERCAKAREERALPPIEKRKFF